MAGYYNFWLGGGQSISWAWNFGGIKGALTPPNLVSQAFAVEHPNGPNPVSQPSSALIKLTFDGVLVSGSRPDPDPLGSYIYNYQFWYTVTNTGNPFQGSWVRVQIVDIGP
jgi:hypothetical protein